MEKLNFIWGKFLHYWAFPPIKIGTGITIMIFSIVHFLLRDGTPTTALIILLIGMGIFIHGLVAGTPGPLTRGPTGTVTPSNAPSSTPTHPAPPVSRVVPAGS